MTRLQRPPAVPELLLHLADELTPLWQTSEEELGRLGVPPPYWAFAWAGGQALARHLLDQPSTVAGATVLDVASGSGLCAIAATLAGAREAAGADVDAFAVAALALNAEANRVAVTGCADDLLDAPPPAVDVVLAGDVCYERPMAERVLPWLAAAAARGSLVLLGDPGRAYLPSGGLRLLATYDVPTTADLEDASVKRAGVYRVGPESRRRRHRRRRVASAPL